MNNIRRATSPQRRAIENMLARGTLTALNRARKMQRIQAKLLGGESKQSMEFLSNTASLARRMMAPNCWLLSWMVTARMVW